MDFKFFQEDPVFFMLPDAEIYRKGVQIVKEMLYIYSCNLFRNAIKVYILMS